MALTRSTLQADSVREECLCVRECASTCAGHGTWHNHPDEVCPIHPDTLVDSTPPAAHGDLAPPVP